MCTLEISFSGVSNSTASKITQELQTILVAKGVPPSAIKLSRASSESMDFGSFLSLDFDTVEHALKIAAGAAQLTYYVVGVIRKHGAISHVKIGDKSTEVTQADADSNKIEDLAKKAKDQSTKV